MFKKTLQRNKNFEKLALIFQKYMLQGNITIRGKSYSVTIKEL